MARKKLRGESEFANGPGTERQSVQQDIGSSAGDVGTDSGWATTVRMRAIDPTDEETTVEGVEFPLGTGNIVPS